jgi:hypothetical protein
MVTVKKDTIQTKKFENKMVKAIKEVKRMDIPQKEKDDILEILRGIHNGCMEWAVPEEEFRILEELKC